MKVGGLGWGLPCSRGPPAASTQEVRSGEQGAVLAERETSARSGGNMSVPEAASMAVRREEQRQKERRPKGDGHHHPFSPSGVRNGTAHQAQPQTRSQVYSLLLTWPEA